MRAVVSDQPYEDPNDPLWHLDPETRLGRHLRHDGDPAGEQLLQWVDRKHDHMRSLIEGHHDYKYFELVREHLERSPQKQRLLPLYALALALQARRIVEFGSSFTYYPNEYDGPWDVTTHPSEGFISTRVFLCACRTLTRLGIPSHLESVDVRSLALEAPGSLDLLQDLGLADLWTDATGAGSDVWLQKERERAKLPGWQPIDLAYVDSNHTYAQVELEMEGVLPFMAERSVIIVDNCYTVAYEVDHPTIPGETTEGMSKGGEYGAILAFIAAHPEWRAEWCAAPFDYMTLTRLPEPVVDVKPWWRFW